MKGYSILLLQKLIEYFSHSILCMFISSLNFHTSVIKRFFCYNSEINSNVVLIEY